MDKGFEIDSIQPANLDDRRGPTFEWKFPDGRSITVYIRRKGCQFGGHFHKGEDPSKNPEKLFVISGKMKLRLVTSNGVEETVTLKQGDTVTIAPNICHYAEAIEDVIFIENRFTRFDPENPDTFQ